MTKKICYLILGFIVLLGTTGFVFVQNGTFSAELSPGVVFEIEVKDHEQSPPRTEAMEISVEGRNIVIPVSSGDGESGDGKMIFRGDKGNKGEVVIVDDEKRAYYVLDESFAEGMASQLSEVDKMMQEAMKNLTKEQREAIEKASQHGGPAIPGMAKPPSKPEVQKTGDRGEKHGYPCVKYEVFQDGRKIREMWTTDWNNVEGGEEAKDAFSGMGAFFDAIWEAFSSMPGGGGPFGGQNPYDEMNFANGFPIVTKNFDEDGGLEDETWLKGTRRQRIDPADFEPPAGYKRMSMGPR